MEKIVQTREIPVCGSYDVIVCGGGPGGWIAAVAAARAGARTALIERYGFVGGLPPPGWWCPSAYLHITTGWWSAASRGNL